MFALLDSLEKQLDEINGRIAYFSEQIVTNTLDTFVITAHLNRYRSRRNTCLAAIDRINSLIDSGVY